METSNGTAALSGLIFGVPQLSMDVSSLARSAAVSRARRIFCDLSDRLFGMDNIYVIPVEKIWDNQLAQGSVIRFDCCS